jgi:hypothetical protein
VLKNGTSNGMIKMVVDKQVDVAVDAFGISTTRTNVVDFTVPLLSTRYGMHFWINVSRKRTGRWKQQNNFLRQTKTLVKDTGVSKHLKPKSECPLIYS